VIYHYHIKQDSKAEVIESNITEHESTEEPFELVEDLNKRSQDVSGRFSVSNNTTFGYGDSYSKRVARLALDVMNIAGTKLSFQSYSNYRNLDNNCLNIHEAILTYDLDSTTTISLGRDINNRMYSLGATDGLHAEKRFKRSFVGIVLGSRPDPYTYTVNTNLFQYGINAGIFHNDAHSSSTSIGFINQTNRGVTDRRYAFLQHNSRLGKDLTIYSSAEIDLYNSAHLRLLYSSANYRVNDKLRLSASLNLRKNLILYESFNQDLVELMANDPLKSSIRFRANYRISNRVYSGASFSVRRQEDGNNSFTNFGGYLNFSELLGGRLSNSFSVNRNDYFQYYSISSRYSRQLLNSKLEISPNVRFLLYSYHNFDINPLKQLYIGVDSDYSVKEDLYVSALYDFSTRSGVPFHRFTVRILQRF